MVDVEDRGGEVEGAHGPVAVVVDARALAGDAEHQPAAAQAGAGRDGEARAVQPQVAQLARAVRAERQPAHGGADAVGADDQVEAAGGAALEGHPYPLGGLGQGGDRVVEDVLDVVPGRLVEDAAQVAAEDLELAAHERGGHVRPGSPGGVDEGDPVDAGPPAADLLQQSHPLQHAQVGAAPEVDGLAARTEGGGPLDHGDAAAGTAQPAGQGGTGDAAAGDERVHRDSSIRLYGVLMYRVRTEDPQMNRDI
nr:hypothetical protein GCM10020093_015290 [Planobispora longispora]